MQTAKAVTGATGESVSPYFFNIKIGIAMYRQLSVNIWTDDLVLSMSPEQKLLFLYLHTSPYSSGCGIYHLQLRTMGFQLGLTAAPIESALRGLAAAFPDLVAIDWETKEVALLQYPKQLLITASKRVMGYVEKEIEKVQSQYLLRELIARNSATLSKPYLSRIRALQMQVINQNRENVEFYGDVVQLTEIQQDDRKKKKEKEKENRESAPAQTFPDQSVKQRDIKGTMSNPDAYKTAINTFKHLAAARRAEYPEKYISPYFLHQQQQGRWHDIAPPVDEGDALTWFGKHYAGLQAWALRQPQFEKATSQEPGSGGKVGLKR